METKAGRFRRTHRFVDTRRGLRGELLALRYELELLDEALGTGETPTSARVALGYAFTHLRAAERAWQSFRHSSDLNLIVGQIDASRDALEASVAARRRGLVGFVASADAEEVHGRDAGEGARNRLER